MWEVGIERHDGGGRGGARGGQWALGRSGEAGPLIWSFGGLGWQMVLKQRYIVESIASISTGDPSAGGSWDDVVAMQRQQDV